MPEVQFKPEHIRAYLRQRNEELQMHFNDGWVARNMMEMEPVKAKFFTLGCFIGTIIGVIVTRWWTGA